MASLTPDRLPDDPDEFDTHHLLEAVDHLRPHLKPAGWQR